MAETAKDGRPPPPPFMKEMRRMSDAGIIDGTDPAQVLPALGLSGKVILATATIPYRFVFDRESKAWELEPRRGNSALFASFNYLAGGTKWETSLVGWPGEVIKKKNQDDADIWANTTVETAPIPIVSGPGYESDRKKDEANLVISKESRQNIENRLEKGDLCGGSKVLPVWLVGDGEGDPAEGDITLKDQDRWTMYAQQEIWPTFHYIQSEPTNGRKERKWWQDYLRFNQAFADKILSVYKHGDIVWIHDYHLLLLPNLLRQKVPDIYIGSFLHAPFPSSEYFRCMTKRKELLQGMLGANMIGFQSKAYAKHFISSCTRVLGFESSSDGVDAYGAHTSVEVIPIGIDAARVEKECQAEGIKDTMAAIKELYADKKIVVGRDRLDSVRGVAQKLRAFEMFLEEYPEWRGKVVLIQITSPSASEGPKLEHIVSELVAHINGTYGSLSFSPVAHYTSYLPQEEYLALLRVADLGLITSVRDGMNTTSLEYVICQKDNHGPVILSEFTGTVGSLEASVQVNPWDTKGVAKAINDCLSMSPEKRKELSNKLYHHVTNNNVQSWVNRFVTKMVVNLSSYDQSQATPALDKPMLLEQYIKASRRLFMFDYDGTLTPIVKDPAAAIPTDRIIRTIKKLASDPKNNVWIVSGRDQKFLEQWMGDIKELGMSAEHGSFIRQPKETTWENLTETMDMSWRKDVIDIFTYYTERTQGSFIEKKECALTWHYRRADPDYGAFQARECQSHLENTVTKKYDVEVMTGKANLEVRPTFVNKGEIAKKLINDYPEGEKPDFILCLGDDTTDEDMFRSLRRTNLPPEHIFAVTVGASSKMTLASWHLLEPSDVINTVALLNGDVEHADVGASVPDAQTSEESPQS